MPIHPRDILLYVAGAALQRYGALSRVTTRIARGGEEQLETFTRASTGYALDRGGVLRIAAIDTPRIEWTDPVTAGVFDTPTLLLEDARTNLLLRSEEFDNAAWTKTRATISANADTAPDGTTTADRLVEDATASSTHFASQNITITADSDGAFSVHAEAGTRTFICIEIVEAAATANFVRRWFNLSTGVVGTSAVGGTGVATRAYIQALGASRYRCTLVGGPRNGATGGQVRVYVADADNSISYNGDGASYAIVWGADFEDNVPFGSSYIKTVGATGTRNRDQCSFPLYAPPQAETLYTRFIERGSIHQTQARIWELGVATSLSPRLILESNGFFYQMTNAQTAGIVQSTLATGSSIGNLIELRGVLAADGRVQLHQSINGGAETSAAQSAAQALAARWSDQLIWLNSVGTVANTIGFNAFHAPIVVRGAPSLADFRALLP